jgi:anti-anti-sigma factor
MGSGKPAIVKQLPRRFVKGQVEQFTREIAALLGSDRPLLVLDLAGVEEIDRTGARALLDYLRQALKGNGDIKLACLPPAVGLFFELMGVERLFETFPSVFDALESFRPFPSENTRVEEFAKRQNAGWLQPGWAEIAS